MAPAVRALLALPLLLAGCLSTPTIDGAGGPAVGGGRGGLETTPDFAYRTLELGGGDAGPLIVVIEGDGAAWPAPDRAPRDPTPRRAIGRALAEMLAERYRVLYLGRPCQFLPPSALAACAPRWWTRDRFDAAVVAAYASRIERSAQGRPVALVGYSGGGVIAAELALRTPAKAALVTVAAPIDLAAWTRAHGVSPLASPSSDRLTVRLGGARFPRVHLVGERDRIVPPRALAALAGSPALRIEPGVDHEGPWASSVVAALAEVLRHGEGGDVDE